MTSKSAAARRFARLGGKARAAKLTPERRKEIAAMGGKAKARKVRAEKFCEYCGAVKGEPCAFDCSSRF